MCITVHKLTYIHPDKEVLFQDISFSVEQKQKIALIGNNGSGKSTLLQILSKTLTVHSGEVVYSATPYYVPQHFGQYNQLNVAEALQIDKKIEALQAILNGDVSDSNFNILADDWTIEEKAQNALSAWGLDHIDLTRKLSELSGGEKTKVFLAGIEIHSPDLILMDEPTNHLDFAYRQKLYDLIKSSEASMLIVSHDRTLLNLLPAIYELSKKGITYYSGNYESYKEQKDIEINSLQAKLDDKEKELRLARKTAREAAERKSKHESRGKKLNLKKGVGKMAMDTLQDKAEKSNARLKDVHSGKVDSIYENLSELRTSLPETKIMKTDFNSSTLHSGKTLVTAENINFNYGLPPLWNENLSFKIKSGERILIRGANGSGKTTLLKIIAGLAEPTYGHITSADFNYVYLDQEYSIIKDDLSVYQQVQQYNSGLLEHEIKIILTRFLFPSETWDKSCRKLSGGEKMKLALCCLMIGANTPDIFILDEPTNNIDIQNINILTSTISDYRGTVLIVSHDDYFVNQMNIDYIIEL